MTPMPSVIRCGASPFEPRGACAALLSLLRTHRERGLERLVSTKELSKSVCRIRTTSTSRTTEARRSVAIGAVEADDRWTIGSVGPEMPVECLAISRVPEPPSSACWVRRTMSGRKLAQAVGTIARSPCHGNAT